MLKMLALQEGENEGPIYPDVDDLSELKVGAVVFVTVSLNNPKAEPKKFALPGIVQPGENKLVIKLLPTKLWEQGWTEIEEVAVDASAHIRFCSIAEELDDDQLISDHYEDQINEVVEICGDKLLKDEPSFKSWVGEKKNKLDFFLGVAEKMATTLSISEWALNRPKDFDDHRSVDNASWFDVQFITPIMTDKTSAMTEEAKKTEFKNEVCPKVPTMAKYLTMMMDILTSDAGPFPPTTKWAKGSRAEARPDLDALTAQVKELKETVATLTGSINAIATHMKVRAATEQSGESEGVRTDTTKPPAPAADKAEIVKVPGDANECAYHVMSIARAVNDGITKPTGAPSFSDDAVDAARLALVMRAKKAFEANPEEFENNMGCSAELMYRQVIDAEQDEKTWPGEYHFVLHADEHPEVELKLKTFREGKLATISTRQVNLPPAKLIMFAHWRPGHYDLLGTRGAGPIKVAFTQEEAVSAELAINNLLAEAKEPMGKLSDEEFMTTVKAALARNRVQPTNKPNSKANTTEASPHQNKPKKSVTWATLASSDDANLQAAEAASLQSFAHEQEREQLRELSANSRQMQAQALIASQRALASPPANPNNSTQAATAASLVSFAHEEEMRQLREQMQAQSKQMQAQAQLGLEARQQVTTLEARLQEQSRSRSKPQQQAPTGAQPPQQGTNPLDLILNGATDSNPAQPAFAIWDNCNKKKVEQALRAVDANAFKLVHSINKVDSGTPNARHIVKALPRDVPTVQKKLMLPMVALGVRADDGSWTQVTSKKGRRGKRGGLAGRAQTGLSNALAKAGPDTFARVNGQCDYYTKGTQCPRGASCRFACYNGPAKQ